MNRLFRMGASWLLRLLVACGALVAMFFALALQGRTGFRTVLFVMEVLEMPVRPQTWFVSQPLRYEVEYPSARGTSVGHIYRLADGKRRAAAVLSIGIMSNGLEDPQAVNLGYALARAGIVVLFDWSPIMGSGYHLDPNEPENLVAAFQYLEQQDFVDRERLGLGGFCVGASSALMAAADPRIRDRIYRISAFGPYHDAEAVLIQGASRAAVYEGRFTPWEPAASTIRVLTNELLMTLSPEEAGILRSHYVDGEPLGQEELDKLSQHGRTVARLLDGVEPAEAEALYATLPPTFHSRLASVSPSHRMGEVQSRILMLSDRNDKIIPPAESRRVFESAPDRNNVRHTELQSFDHVTVSDRRIRSLMMDAIRLYRHMYEIVRVAS